jgi:tRNA(fMet)-specific endonuclease VapC
LNDPNTYMLDTNICSYIVSGRYPNARQQVKSHGDDIIVISAITEAELRFGLEKKPEATRWRQGIQTFLDKVTILPWDSLAAREYGTMRANLTKNGKTLSALDLLIAAHAASIGAVLVTGDRAFQHIGGVTVNWADDI